MSQSSSATDTYRTRRTRQAVACLWPSRTSSCTSSSSVEARLGVSCCRSLTPWKENMSDQRPPSPATARQVSELTAMLFLRSVCTKLNTPVPSRSEQDYGTEYCVSIPLHTIVAPPQSSLARDLMDTANQEHLPNMLTKSSEACRNPTVCTPSWVTSTSAKDCQM